MATNSFQSLRHHSLRRRHSIDLPPTTTPRFLRPTTTNATVPSLSSSSSSSSTTTTAAFSLSPPSTVSSTTTSSEPPPVSYDLLKQHLSSQNFRAADEETRRLLILLAGESAVKRGYVFFSEVQFIPESDLKAVDDLWTQYSNNKFGYSVQKKIWKKSRKDFTKFFLKVGWMKKLESSEIEQYNYRSFPNEFIWDLNDETPDGHLPLTNALRGIQLLSSILTHPAFGSDGDDDEEETGKANGSLEGMKRSSSKPLSSSSSSGGGGGGGAGKSPLLKPDYSF